VAALGNSKDLIALKNKAAGGCKESCLPSRFPRLWGPGHTPLPGTKLEVDEINRILKASGYKTSELTQKLATEKA